MGQRHQALRTTNAPERVLTAAELTDLIPLNRSTIWRLVSEKRFPAPIQLTAARIGWRWSAVLQWLAEREADPITPRKYPDMRGRKRRKKEPETSAPSAANP
jgi:prophage regulatory protein